MKKLRLRKWVKVALCGLIIGIFIGSFIVLMDKRLRYACKHQGYNAICPVDNNE